MLQHGEITLDDDTRCPCFSGEVYGGCCAPLHRGGSAPTAERLMRSRYTAFALGDAAYLMRSWHSSTRPGQLDLDDDLQWRRLVIVGRDQGGPFDREGTVDFEAHWRDGESRGVLREHSRFVREGRDWFYIDGDVLP